MVVSKDEIVNLSPGTGDEFGLHGGFWQGSEKFARRRQDSSLDDIDVGRFFHGGGKLWFSPLAGKPVMSGVERRRAPDARATILGKNKAGRLPLTGPLLLS